jgi:hypothetical protein
MLLNRFKKVYSHRLSGIAKNRIGMIRNRDGGSRMTDRHLTSTIKSSSKYRAQLRIHPSEKRGGISVN